MDLSWVGHIAYVTDFNKCWAQRFCSTVIWGPKLIGLHSLVTVSFGTYGLFSHECNGYNVSTSDKCLYTFP